MEEASICTISYWNERKEKGEDPSRKERLPPAHKMHLQSHLKWDNFQVPDKGEHPDCNQFGYIPCPLCSRRLYGHGWRKRYLEKEKEVFVSIWIHGKRCPDCRKTYTIIPEGMGAVVQYPLDRIKEVLAYISEHGHCSKSLLIPSQTQKRWWRNFTARVKAATGMFPCRKETDEALRSLTALSTLPVGWIEVRDSAFLRGLATRRTRFNHMLYLLHPRAPC